ncbi:ATP-binding protein [Streptomyces sp. NPDC058657]|uniref:ATP-binding protein n=1 Tax=unclassified Streptomyces TaxID=2593676 RepID=UPI0036462293
MDLPPAGPLPAPAAEVRRDFDGTPGCIAEARAAADAFLARHAPQAGPTFHDDVLLVVSELVTNAVRHAPGPLVLELGLAPGGVLVGVRDREPRPPHSRVPDLTGGHGWPIVQRLSRRVDVTPDGEGKTVRAELAW